MLQDFLSEKHKKKRKKRQNISFILAAIVVVVVLVGMWWLLFRSPILQMRGIVVRGNDVVASSDVVALLTTTVKREHGVTRWIFGTGNMLSWPTALASSDISSTPQILDLALDKNYWNHTITAMVTERQPFANWCDMPKIGADGNPEGDESCYWFDTSGIMFETGFDTEGSALFAIHDYSQDNAALGGTILPSVFVPNLISVLNTLKASDLTVKEVALNDIGLQEIDVTTYDGPIVYFSLRFSADEDLPVLQNLMTQPDFSKIQYIDFRVENRAYYK